MSNKKQGRPRKGKEFRKVYSIRLEPSIAEMVIADYGSLTEFINSKINAEMYELDEIFESDHIIDVTTKKIQEVKDE